MRNKFITKRYCPIQSCEYFTGCTNFSEISFFRIPMDPQQRQEWLREITKHQKINGTFSVCQLHFEEKYLKFVKDSRKAKLLPNAVPTIFTTNPSIQTVTVDHVDEPSINIKQEDPQNGTMLDEISTPPPKRFKIEENPDGFSSEKPCYKCINMDVKVQGQKVKIDRLRRLCDERQEIIRTLRNELARYKNKVEALQENYSTVQLVKCPVCRQKTSDKNHICDGRKEINCDYCGVTFNSTVDLVNHLSILHDQKQFFNCDKCPIVYSMDLLLQFHRKWHPDGEPLVACDACDAKSLTQHQLNIHKDESHGETNFVAQRFQCGKCGKCFAEALDLEKHIKTHDSKAFGKFECFICKDKLKSLYATRIHLRNLHQRDDKCTICNENLTSIELGEHMCGGLREMKCAYCKKSFKAMKDLLQHLKEDCQSEKLIYRCDICSKFYAMKILKDIHVKYGHSNKPPLKPHTCDECAKNFATKIGLQIHKKRHLLTQDHLCDECGKGFKTLRNMMKHKLGHGEKRHECELCGERFTKIEQLKLHREQKHEKNKYVCGTCNKTIASRKRLWSHMKIHTRTEADRKYACTICPLKFFDNESLNYHLRRVHTTARPFECEFCKSAYKHKGDLSKHIKVTHPHIKNYKIVEAK